VSYVAGDAATVVLDSAGGILRIVAFAPHPGWFTVRLEQPSATQFDVRLESASGQVHFSAQLVNGAVTAQVDGGGSTPGASAPGGSAPGGSAPGGSAPGGSAPGGSAPGNTAPGGGDDNGGDDNGGDDNGGGGGSGRGSGGGGDDDNSGSGD
jgi:hypothetical protein